VLGGTFFLPLLVSPVFAFLLAGVVYTVFRRTRLALGVTRETCVCVAETYEPVTVAVDGSLIVRATGLKIAGGKDRAACVERYGGRVVGLDAQRIVDGVHLVSAGAISFARGLNDTPKIAAVLVAAGAFSQAPSVLGVGAAIALGGLLAARRVTHTMSERITEMNDGQALTANLVTAGLVVGASRLGVPVSTTHVSCGSLFGIGLVSRRAHLRVIGQVLLAWVTTLPVAAALGFVSWTVLTR
ncbi:MAG: inorganic phosphate transporter, partial [Planctomycetota bacterium]